MRGAMGLSKLGLWLGLARKCKHPGRPVHQQLTSIHTIRPPGAFTQRKTVSAIFFDRATTADDKVPFLHLLTGVFSQGTRFF